MNVTFTNDEINLMCIYTTSDKKGLIDSLAAMRELLEDGETELLELTNSTIRKLKNMEDTEFAELELCPDF